VLGVNGDSQVAAWSSAAVGGIPIDKFLLAENDINQKELEEECKHESQSIIRIKGASPLGMGSAMSEICASILMDKRDIFPISHFQQEFGCCFSMPAVLGRNGIIRTAQVPLNKTEATRVAESAKAPGEGRRTL
jgi:L-lactate dehydrogenase